MTVSAATAESLGELHQMLADTYKQMIAPREMPIMVKGEPLLDEDGNVRTYTMYPTAAETAAAATFLKNNNIVAPTGNTDALAELAELMEKRKSVKLRPVLTDPYAEIPAGYGGLN